MVPLRVVRRAAGYDLADLALAASLSVAQVSRAERGLRRLSPGARVRIARALDLDLQAARAIPELAPNGGKAT